MKPKLLASMVVVVGLVAAWLVHDRGSRPPESRFRGKTTSQWARTLRDWRVAGEIKFKWTRITSWSREPPLFESWLEKLGLAPQPQPVRLSLLEGDAEAVPVLIELLQRTDPKVRRIAVQGLGWIGEAAKPAVPALLGALDDKDLRSDVEQALFRVDWQAAEAAGLKDPCPFRFRLR
jgi:hypothetical protein